MRNAPNFYREYKKVDWNDGLIGDVRRKEEIQPSEVEKECSVVSSEEIEKALLN